MAHSIRTLLLDDKWDIYLNRTGKIAVGGGPYSTAQAVANEVRRFLNDSYFDYDTGVPHFEVELGHQLPESALRSFVRRAALRVEDVAEIIDIELDGFDRETRTLMGRISFTAASGAALAVNI